MRVDGIRHLDVVAHKCAVASQVVLTEYLDFPMDAKRRLDGAA